MAQAARQNPANAASARSGHPARKKCLHLGVLHGGRFIAEQWFTEQKPVSIGAATSATVLVPASAGVGDRFTLFEPAGNKYQLSFSEQMNGRILVDNTEVELRTLRDKGLAKKHGALYRLPLVDKARGTIEVGSVVVVFDFAPKPPEPRPLELPLQMRSNLVGGFDVLFSGAVTACSLLFGLFLAFLSTVPVPEEVTLDQIDDRFVKMIAPKMLKEEPPPSEGPKTPDAPKAEKKEEKKEESKPKPDEDDAPAMEARKKDIQQKVAGKGVLAIIGMKGQKGAIADVFSEGKAINGDIDSAFAGIGGVEVANGGNTTSRGGGGAGTSSSIGNLATSGGGSVGLGEKAETKVVGNVKSEAPEVDGSLDQADIARVVRGRLTAIKECYERELKRNPQLSGKVVVRFTIDEEGRVTGATLEENTISEKAVGQCVLQRVERFRFPKPDGGSVTVSYPFIFAPGG